MREDHNDYSTHLNIDFNNQQEEKKKEISDEDKEKSF